MRIYENRFNNSTTKELHSTLLQIKYSSSRVPSLEEISTLAKAIDMNNTKNKLLKLIITLIRKKTKIFLSGQIVLILKILWKTLLKKIMIGIIY